MKGALTAVISALALGVLSAAEVSGGNNVVVVQKDVRQSSTGWQLLCVPVNGFDIANGKEGEIDINDLLPAAYYNVGSTVYTVDATGTSTLACELKSNSETGTVAWDGDTTTLTGGQTFWVKNSTAKTLASGASFIRALASGDTTSSDDTADTILFCGQERTRATLSRPDSGMKLLQNDGAEAVTLANIVSSPVAGDTILTIQNGKKNYMYYTYDGDQWIKNSKPKEDISAVTILPGEAFYYNSFTAE